MHGKGRGQRGATHWARRDPGKAGAPLRSLPGEQNHQHKLTEDQVREMRRRSMQDGASRKALAAEYGVSSVLISLIVRRKAGTHRD